MSNLADDIYDDFSKEVEALKLRGDMSAVEVIGELTRALKRVTNRHGGTAYIENGVHYDVNDNELNTTGEGGDE